MLDMNVTHQMTVSDEDSSESVSDLYYVLNHLPNFFKFILIFLNFMAVVFHSFGLYLLLKVKRASSNAHNTDMVFYTNFRLLVLLSISELFYSFFLIVIFVIMPTKNQSLLVAGGVFIAIEVGFVLSVIYLITLN